MIRFSKRFKTLPEGPSALSGAAAGLFLAAALLSPASASADVTGSDYDYGAAIVDGAVHVIEAGEAAEGGEYKGAVRGTVIVKDDYTGAVYGWNFDTATVDPPDEGAGDVEISGGATVAGHVYGGYSAGDADATNNSVSVADSVVTGTSGSTAAQYADVYGGYSENGDVKDNTVTISNSTIRGYSNNRAYVYGGYSDYGDVEGNEVVIRDGSAIENTSGAVYGGYSEYGAADSNTVVVDGTNARNTVSPDIYGGHGGYGYGEASYNTVTISGSDVRSVYGGGGSGYALGNEVSIVDGSTAASVRGGSGYGYVYHNTVTVEDSTVTGNIRGGWAQGMSNPSEEHANLGHGSPVENYVYITNSDVSSYVYGGYGSSSMSTGSFEVDYAVAYGNVVVMRSDSDVRHSSGGVYGGYMGMGTGSTRPDSAIANFVYIEGYDVNGNVHGGRNDGYGVTSENVVVLVDTAVSGEVYGAENVYGAAGSGVAQIFGGDEMEFGGNEVYMYGSSTTNVYGGVIYYAEADANDNVVEIRDGTQVVSSRGVYGEVAGAYNLGDGDASSNTVVISGRDETGQASKAAVIYGGRAENGNADSNAVVVSDHAEVEAIYAGYATGGDAKGNTIDISGGTISGEVYGGYVASGEGYATDNAFVVSNAADDLDIGSAVLIGGLNAAMPDDHDRSTSGNSLRVSVYGKSVRADNVKNFESLDVYFEYESLPDSNDWSNAPLVLADASGAGTDLSRTRVNAEGKILGSGSALSVGDVVPLVYNENGKIAVDPDVTLGSAAIVHQGISMIYDGVVMYDADLSESLLYIEITDDNGDDDGGGDGGDGGTPTPNPDPDPGPGPAGKLVPDLPYTEGMATLTGFLGSGTDFALGTAWDLLTHERLGIYLAGGGTSTHYHHLGHGSHSYLAAGHVMFGTAARFTDTPEETDVLGTFYMEAGWGDVEHGNRSYSGDGAMRYYGLGLIARWQRNEGDLKGLYFQPNARIGRAALKFDVDGLSDVDGKRGTLDDETFYYGAGATTGYVYNVNDNWNVDLSVRYQWLHVEGFDTVIANDPYSFSDVDSHTLRVGPKAIYTTKDGKYDFSLGGYWEREFSGRARGKAYGLDLQSTSLKGDTGIAEAGMTAYFDENWLLDVTLQGFAGAREGVAGQAVLEYRF